MLSRGYTQRAVVWFMCYFEVEQNLSSHFYAKTFTVRFWTSDLFNPLVIFRILVYVLLNVHIQKSFGWSIKKHMPLKPITSRSPCAINIRHDSSALLSNLLWRAAGLKKKSEVRVKGVLYFICINIGNNLQSRSADMFLIKTSDPLSTSPTSA